MRAREKRVNNKVVDCCYAEGSSCIADAGRCFTDVGKAAEKRCT